MFGKSFDEKVQAAVQELRGLGVKNLGAKVDGKVVTLTGDAPDLGTKTRVMSEFNARVETDNTVNQIRVEKPTEPVPRTAPAATAPVTTSGLGPSTASVAAPAATAAPAPPTARLHEVAKGDTLSAIAKKYYGKAGEYHRIFEANKDVLKDPDHIFPGQKLRIPEGP